MKTKYYLLLALLFGFGLQVNAQTKNCKVDYEVEITEMPEDMDPMAAGMMKDMTMTLAFQGTASRVEMHMSMGDVIAIVDDEKQEGVTLMNMMGMKMATVMTEGMLKAQKDQKADVKPDGIRETGETKKIAGYKCHQVFVENEGNEVEMWITKDIVVNNKSNQYIYEGIKGFPLEMFVDQEGMKMRMTASEVSTKKMDKDLFSTEVPEGYTIQGAEGGGLGY